MNKIYIYTQNIRASATLWFLILKDFVIIVIAALFYSLVLAAKKIIIPSVLFAENSLMNSEKIFL